MRQPCSLYTFIFFSLFQETSVDPSDGIVLRAVNFDVTSVAAALDLDFIAGIELADLVGRVIGCAAVRVEMI